MTMLELNDLLRKADLDPASIMVMRHRPTEGALRRVLPWLAQEQPDVFNAYQSQHRTTVETALLNARYLASFIGHEAGQALFVGLYEMRGGARVSPAAYWAMPPTGCCANTARAGPQRASSRRGSTLRRHRCWRNSKGGSSCNGPASSAHGGAGKRAT